MPIGTALAGALSSAFGPDAVFAGCALVFLAAGMSPLFVTGTRRLVKATGVSSQVDRALAL
jgi:hypothetical protein